MSLMLMPPGQAQGRHSHQAGIWLGPPTSTMQLSILVLPGKTGPEGLPGTAQAA